MARDPLLERPAALAFARATKAALVASALGGCALIAGVPDVELAAIGEGGASDAPVVLPPIDGESTDAGADARADVAAPDAGPRCRFEDAFERDVIEIGSLNVRGMCSSVGFTADEKVAAVASFVNGLGATPDTSWALFTLARTVPNTYDGQVQHLVAGSAAFRDDGLALVVAPDTEGKGALKEYARPRLDGVFTGSGDVTSVAAFDTKKNPSYMNGDTVFLDGKRTPTSAVQIFRLTRNAGALEAPQAIDGLPAGAETPVPSRDGEWLYVSVCVTDGGTRCLSYRAKRSAGTTFGAVEPLSELGDFRARWLSVDGCRLYGTRANRPAYATKLPR